MPRILRIHLNPATVGALALGLWAICAQPAPAQSSWAPETSEERGWRIGRFVEAQCGLAADAKDGAALDQLAAEGKAKLSELEKTARDYEESLKQARESAAQWRNGYRLLTVDTVKAQEAVEAAERNGTPATAMEPLRARLREASENRRLAQSALVLADRSENESVLGARAARQDLTIGRVALRSVEICIEKRRAELGTPVVGAPATPTDPMAPPFSLAGTWAGACDQGTKVNGTFTVAVAKGGAVSGKYVYSSGSSGALAGTLGPDGKLAVGSGDSSFSVRWVGSVVAAGGARTGSGTWSGSGSGLKCGGAWNSGPPA